MSTGDQLRDALTLLVGGDPCFDQISFDPEGHCLSFRRAGMRDEYVNVWLNAGPELEHRVERNGGGAAQVIWRDGEHVDDERRFVFTLPAYTDPASVEESLRGRVEHRSQWPREW